MGKETWTEEELEIIKRNWIKYNDKELTKLVPRHTDLAIARQRRLLKLTKTNQKYTFLDVINEFKKTDYILLSTEDEYINAAANTIRYLCPRHLEKGELKISLGHLQCGRGCYYCGRETTEKAHELNDDINNKQCMSICEKAGVIFCNSYRDSSTGLWMIEYLCPYHKELGIQIARKGNLKRDVSGCPYCVEMKGTLISKGSKYIIKYLKSHNINYIMEYTFKDCKDQHVLPFDFYLPQYNKIIEYDGGHHFKPITYNRISMNDAIRKYNITVEHDKIKDEYCKSHNIPLLRIPYYKQRDIEMLLNSFLNIL